MTANSTVANIIKILNTYPSNMLSVQRFMLLARIQRAAKLGDADAQRFVALCELNVETASRH
jgi:hypothetical protein